MSPGLALFVVLPVFDEEAVIAGVIREWVPVLRRDAGAFRIHAIDDGSRDGTRAVLEKLAAEIPELEVVSRPNVGHGATCREGYTAALESGAPWILQLDSDGQCDPGDLPRLWNRRDGGRPVYGRRRREDGALRVLVSGVLRGVVRLAAGVDLPDANVPFRLMPRDSLESAVASIPADFELANVALAVVQERRVGIHWVRIRFRARPAGEGGLSLAGFVRRGVRVFRELRKLPRR